MSNSIPKNEQCPRWFGVDFDGTLATSPGENWNNGETLGKPVKPMLAQVKALLAHGEEVRIFTARVGVNPDAVNGEGQAADEAFCARQRQLIEEWCVKHVGQKLKVTAVKDFQMVALFDDRACQIIRDKGIPVVEDAMNSLAVAEALYASLEGCTLTPRAKAIANELHKALGLPDTLKLEFNEKKIITR